MAASAKPIPEADSESKPFWDGVRDHVLLIQECRHCGKRRLPATTYCPACRSSESAWVKASGRGRVFSWIVVHHPVPREAYAEEVPYVVALIELDEGVRIVSNIVGTDASCVAADMKVQVVFEGAPECGTLPKFTAA